jgi:opacity protein-like surface antigen
VLPWQRPLTDEPEQSPAYLPGLSLYEAIEPAHRAHNKAAAPDSAYPVKEVTSPSSTGTVARSPVFKAPTAPAPPPPAWLWSGLYVGLHVGGAAGTANFADPFGPSIFGDTVRTPAFLGGGQIGFNWQAPNSQWVFGIQGEISGFSSEGTATCFAYSGNAINTTCRVTPQVAGTITGRVGYAAGADGRTLVYVKGGFAWAENHVDMATNNLFGGFIGPPNTSNSSSLAMWGGTAGAGVEYVLTPAWSLFAEYDYLGFASNNVTNLGSATVSPLGVTTSVIPPSSSGVRQNIQEFKLGVNYKLGVDPWSLGRAGGRNVG